MSLFEGRFSLRYLRSGSWDLESGTWTTRGAIPYNILSFILLLSWGVRIQRSAGPDRMSQVPGSKCPVQGPGPGTQAPDTWWQVTSPTLQVPGSRATVAGCGTPRSPPAFRGSGFSVSADFTKETDVFGRGRALVAGEPRPAGTGPDRFPLPI